MSDIYNDILEGLTTTSYPLEDILLKLKVLAHKLKNKELTDFVNSELQGYNNDDNVPQYRIYKGVLMGSVENAVCRRQNEILITSHLKEYDLADINQCVFTDNVSTLIEYSKTGDLTKVIPREFYNILSLPFGNGYQVTTAYVPVDKAIILGILNAIRDTLLNLMFAIEDQFNQAELATLFKNPTKEQKDKANPIINNFFNSFGNSIQNTKIELETDI